METNKSNRIERKKAETKKKIIDVAMDLFKKQGFDQTTVEQIANEADVAKGTIFNHFPVKEAIISEYVQREIRRQRPEALRFLQELPDTRSRLLTLFHKSLEWAETELNRDLYKKYCLYRMHNIEQAVKDQSLRSGFDGILAHVIGLGQGAGEIRQDIPAEILAHQLEALHSFAVVAWLAAPEKFSVYKGIACNVDLFLDGAINKESKE